LGKTAIAFGSKVSRFAHIIWRIWVPQPPVGDDPFANTPGVNMCANGDNLSTDICALNAWEGDGSAAPSGVVIANHIKSAACGRIRHGFGVPARARVHVRVVEPAGSDSDQHLIGSGLWAGPISVQNHLIYVAMAHCDHRSHSFR
jgi:hypothetical protein